MIELEFQLFQQLTATTTTTTGSDATQTERDHLDDISFGIIRYCYTIFHRRRWRIKCSHDAGKFPGVAIAFRPRIPLDILFEISRKIAVTGDFKRSASGVRWRPVCWPARLGQ